MSVKSARLAHVLEANCSKFNSTGLLKVKSLRPLIYGLEREGDLVVGSMLGCGRPGFEPVTANTMLLPPQIAKIILKDSGQFR